MRLVISPLPLPHQGGMTTVTLVALASENPVSENHEKHAIGIHEISENSLLGSSESPLHRESTVNLQRLGSIANHFHPKNHLHLGW